MSRSETVSVRLDPKLRYLAELAARKQRRTLSSYIEWAVEESLRDVILHVGTGYNGDENLSVSDESRRLWDVDESERFIKLAIAYPDLLTHEEQERWKMVGDSGLLSPAKRRTTSGYVDWDHAALDDHVYPAVRKFWGALLEAHASGPAARSNWVNTMSEKIRTGSVYATQKPQPSEDDIPF